MFFKATSVTYNPNIITGPKTTNEVSSKAFYSYVDIDVLAKIDATIKSERRKLRAIRETVIK